ncbi:MAG: caspase family protein [Leptolyngbyaceae cyanobacterium bins.302]|nr:caspase family protein [Leptolyngbyaceae cyanobacterium bins.302]
MKKVALLIGVSQYDFEFEPLPATRKDVEAMQRVLQHPDIGGFDQVTTLIDPTSAEMQEKIDALFQKCDREDLVLLYFSGHGVTDDSGTLYFTTRQTRKAPSGNISEWTAVAANFVQGKMNTCKSQRKILIIDCCFSGAFLTGTKHKKGEEAINLSQLMGEGRVILTSSSSIETSHGTSDSGLSLYTHHLVNGIESGEADYDRDGKIKVENLYEYVRQQLKHATPQMTPRILSEQEGGKIVVAYAPARDPESMYGRQVVRLIQQGEISVRGQQSFYTQQVLALLQRRLRLYPEEAKQIEQEMLKPYQQHYHRCQLYRRALSKVLRNQLFQDLSHPNNPHRQTLLHLQQELNLSDTDAEQIKSEVLALVRNHHRWLRMALAGLGIGVTASLVTLGILTSRIYAHWNLPQSLITSLDHWHGEIVHTKNHWRVHLAQQISGDADSLETALTHFLQAEQAMQKAKTYADWRGAEKPWQETVDQLQRAIAHLNQAADQSRVARYRQYLTQKKQEADSALEFAKAIAPAFQALDRKRKSKQSGQERSQIVAFSQQAIMQMKAIPKSSPYYSKAQAKLSIYRSWLNSGSKRRHKQRSSS